MMGVFVHLNAASVRKGRSNPVGYVVTESGCYEWVGPINRKTGYGVIVVDGKAWPAHRYVYTLERGPIPDGMVPDHLCRNRSCVRPDHIEVVTFRENVLRGIGPTAVNARKTHCANGHPLTEANMVPSYLKRGERRCYVCHQKRTTEWKREHRRKIRETTYTRKGA